MEDRICGNCQYWAEINRREENAEGEEVEMVFYDAAGRQMEASGRCLVDPITRIVGVRETRQLGPITMYSDTCEKWTAK